ncbi:MAG: helix-turn-helix domain-containing protein [Bacteriovoracaceae bacterium]
MPRRSESYNQFVAEKMQDPEYAKETLLVSIEEFGESIEEALKYTIQLMGAKEFSEKALVPYQNVSDFIRGKRKPKIETLNKYLSVFNLKAKIVVVDAA